MSRRLFFGLKPDEQARNGINRSFRLQPDFEGSPPHPEDFHMTLIYLGEIQGRLDCIKQAASEIVAPEFSLCLDRFDYWPRPKVLVLRPSSPPDALLQLFHDLRKGIARCNFVDDGRPYKPHVTLARKARAIEAEGPKMPVEWTVDRFCLYVSTPVSELPRYRIIDSWALHKTT